MVALPDYETTLRENAFRVLREEGIAEDRLSAEWDRLRRAPTTGFEVPTIEQLENMELPAGAGAGARNQ